MKKQSKNQKWFAGLLLGSSIVLGSGVGSIGYAGGGTPSIWVEMSQPIGTNEMLVYGMYLMPGTGYEMVVKDPNGMETSSTVVTDGSGAIPEGYPVNANETEGVYTVLLEDASGNVVATTQFSFFNFQ